jgi:hypothetical protein
MGHERRYDSFVVSFFRKASNMPLLNPFLSRSGGITGFVEKKGAGGV